jgi:ribosomal protein S4E
MLDAVQEFWGYVERDEEPINYDIPLQVSTDKILVDDMVRRDARFDNEFMDAAVTYTQYQQHNVVFENAKKSLKEMVADNEREVYCDQISIRRDKRGSLRINTRKEK